jgi:hypothetical protein
VKTTSPVLSGFTVKPSSPHLSSTVARAHWMSPDTVLDVPKRVLYMNLGTTRLRGRPKKRWQDEVREDGRMVGGEGWQQKIHNRNGRSSWGRQGIV